MKRVFYFAMLIFLLVSCKENTFEEILFRTQDDPFNDCPITDSLQKENTIYLHWQEDIASDCFYLMRSLDQIVLNFSCVYKGTETDFFDTNLENNNRYIYRLDKQRGNKRFEGTEYSYGYSSNFRNDYFEFNDNEENATLLVQDLKCNLPCIKYIYKNKTLIDVDWFYVEIPARRKAEILINQEGLSNSSTGTDTSLYIQEIGSTEKSVKQNTAILIENPSTETKKIFFKVFPKTTALFSEDSYQTVIEYTISLNKIFKY